MYDALVALHVISAVIGFGAVGVTGVYGGMARRSAEPGGDDETRRYFAGSLRAEWVLLVVPFLGLAALLSGPKRHDGGDVWVLASAGLWLIAAGLLIHVVRPAEQQIRAVTTVPPDSEIDPPSVGSSRPGAPGRPPPAGATGGDLQSAARTLMRASLVTDLLFVVALALMVAQPS